MSALRGTDYYGRVYVSASGGMTEDILIDMIVNVFAPLFPERSVHEMVGILCDAYGKHWDIKVYHFSAVYAH